MGCLGCRNHFLIRCIGLAHNQVFSYRSRLQPGFLQHHTIIFTQALSGELTDIGIIHRNASRIHIIETHEQVDNRGLAAAGRPDNRHSPAAFHMQIQILD